MNSENRSNNSDEAIFEEAAKYVLEKNRELHERLAKVDDRSEVSEEEVKAYQKISNKYRNALRGLAE